MVAGIGTAFAGIVSIVVWRRLYDGPKPRYKPLVATVVKPIENHELTGYLAKNEKSPDPKVQDKVSAVKIRLAYNEAKAGHWETARQQLLKTSHEYKGTGAMGADFGGIPDQAAYQAAVCLVAEGKKADAQKEFRTFIHDRPLSPLVTACYRRLVRLNDGQSLPADEKTLQVALDKQTVRVKLEKAACGPKAVAYLLPKLGHTSIDYHEIAKICGTGSHDSGGTTLEQLRKGLAQLGVRSFAYRLNREDLQNAPMPAILLVTDHYMVLCGIKGNVASLYDPLHDEEREAPLPDLDSPSFSADLILFSQPELHLS